MGLKMADYGFQFKSPTSYGDWASYAGFDRTTGETDFFPPPSAKQNTPVPPPATTEPSVPMPVKPTVGVVPKTTGMGMGSSGYSFGTTSDLLNAVNKHLFGE